MGVFTGAVWARVAVDGTAHCVRDCQELDFRRGDKILEAFLIERSDPSEASPQLRFTTFSTRSFDMDEWDFVKKKATFAAPVSRP